MTKKPKILIVDDDHQILDLLRILLRVELGFENEQVLLCSYSPKALELAKQHQPQAVLLDILMPVQDGREVLRELKADPETAHIPVIMISVLCTKEVIGELRELGAAEYITKPFDTKKLAATIRQIISIVERL